MYATEFDDFKQTLADLCTSVNRPFSDDLVRVFWEDLKPTHLSAIRGQAKKLRAAGKTRFTASDLRPEETSHPAPSTFDNTKRDYDHFHCFGQKQMFKFLRLHDVRNDQLPALIARKNEIIDAARHDPDMQVGGDEEEQGRQLHEILFSAWQRVLQS